MLEPNHGAFQLVTILIHTPTVPSAGPALRRLKRSIVSAVRHKLAEHWTIS